MMKKLISGPADKAIERILELSADAQIGRREIAKGSLAYYTSTEKIAAYGKALALLTALQRSAQLAMSFRPSLGLRPVPIDACRSRCVMARLVFWFTYGLLLLCFVRTLLRPSRISQHYRVHADHHHPGSRNLLNA